VRDVTKRNEGEFSLDTGHDKTVHWYAQPSMGVVVCPATFLANGTRVVDEDCYYVYKWIGAWKKDPERWETYV
jgi:hypothetical protein